MNIISTALNYLNILFWKKETHEELDPQVQKILSYLNKSKRFFSLMNELEAKNLKAEVKFLSFEESKNQKIFKSILRSTEIGNLFSYRKNEILLDNSYSLVSKCQNLLIEYCNLFYINELIDLDSKAKTDTITREYYIYSKEMTEFNALKKYMEIATEIDDLALFEKGEKMITEQIATESQNFETYFETRKSSGHAENYGKMWDKCRYDYT